MGAYCYVIFCKSQSAKSNVSFHEFPSEETLRIQWITNISRKGFIITQKLLCYLSMTSKTHQELVAVIRGVPDNMRKECFKSGGDYEKVWQDHLRADDVREHYAQSMLKLATSVWSQSNSRIDWCYMVIKNYFYDGGLEKSLKRHLRCLLWQKHKTKESILDVHIDAKYIFCEEKYRLLDVGSCYNPFSKFLEFETVSLDLTPATQDVYKCDFLQLEVIPSSGHMQSLPTLPGPLYQLQEQSFHIVVFSLFLSYLPAAKQRFISCYKAWKLLKENGMLLIVTPDSKNQHCNSSMIRSWKTALEYLGFMKVVYKKETHLHCMAYRKTLSMTFDLNSGTCMDISKMMYIPQDFKKFQDTPSSVVRTEEQDNNIKNSFSELPLCYDL